MDVKISAKDSHHALYEVCKGLDESTKTKLHREYKHILAWSERKSKSSRMYIVEDYGIRYEDISFRDLINHVKQKSKE